MEQIRVNKGIEIGVNDNGDSIFLDVNSTGFLNRYNELIKNIQRISDEIHTDIEDEDEELNEVTNSMEKVVVEMDKLLGVDACKKIFGEGFIPTPYAVIDFLDQLEPIVRKYTTEREEKIINKYKPRKGGKRV